MSSNILESVENFNVQANILENYVRDEDICTQVYYSLIDSSTPLEILKTSLGTHKSICRFLEQI
jgi:hypothetical protein